jgi:ABC-type hemin transport system substrate-binding protein
MSIGPATYGGSLLRRLGVELVGVGSGDPYPTVELAAVAATAPDLVLVPSEPYAFSDAHLDELASALPSSEVRRIDGQDLFWWGIRTPDAFRRLAETLT